MNLEKSVSITAPMADGYKLGFTRDGDDLKITLINENVTLNSATLTEADLRGLVRELFPSKRAPKAAGATVGNGTSRKRRGETTSA